MIDLAAKILQPLAEEGGTSSMISDMMPIMIPVLIIVIVLAFVMKYWKDRQEKKKAKEMVDLPRDAGERIKTSWSKLSKSKLNYEGMRHTLFISGDRIRQGFRCGDIIDVQPKNELFGFAMKKRWWYFWRKAMFVYCLPEMVTDMNVRNIVLEARGLTPIQENVFVAIPIEGTLHLERYYALHDLSYAYAVHRMTSMDLTFDEDWLLKMAMRGDLAMSLKEVGQYEEMPQITRKRLEEEQRGQASPYSKTGASEPPAQG